MSEYSDSFHLLGSDTSEAADLLKKAKSRGFVFPASDGRVAFAAESMEYGPNKAVINANTGTLIHYVNAEDFGVIFTVYVGSGTLFSYSCMWDGEIVVDDSKLDYSAFAEWLRKNTSKAPLRENIEAMLHPAGFEEIFDGPPLSARIAELLQISNYEWVSYHYMELRSSQGKLDPSVVFID